MWNLIKKYYPVITVLVCLALLVWALLPVKEEKSTDLYATPPVCSNQDVKEISIARASSVGTDGIVRLLRVDVANPDTPDAVSLLRAEWNISTPDLGEADPLFVQRIVGELCFQPLAQRIGVPDPVQLKLTDPVISAELRFLPPGKSSPETWVFRFGAALPQQRVALQLIRNGENNFFYSVPDSAFQLLSTPAERFRNRRLVKLPIEHIERVQVSFAGKAAYSAERGNGSWRIFEEGKEIGISSQEFLKFMNRLTTLRAMEIEAKEVTMERCQELAGAIQIDLEGADRSVEHLHFGKPEDSSGENRMRMYACNSARKALFRIHKDMWIYLNEKIDAYVDRYSK